MSGREAVAGALVAVVIAVLIGGWGALAWWVLVAALIVTVWEPHS